MPGEDGRLIARMAAGDTAALAALMAEHREAVWRTVRLRARDDGTAEDALQETFLAAWRGASAWRGESARGWLLGIARRQAARTWRRRAGEPAEAEPLSSLGLRAGWSGDDPEAAAARAEDGQRLDAALSALTAEDREVITLRDLEGFTAPEAAALLGIAPPALKSRLHRARLRLMAALRAEGGPDDEA